jgi:FixJ family two-component response regulator
MNASAQEPQTGAIQPYRVSTPASHLCAAYPGTQLDSPLVFLADDDNSGGEVLEGAIRAMEFAPVRVKSADVLFQIAKRKFVSCLIMDTIFLEREGLSIPELIDGCAMVPVIFTARSCDIATSVTAMKAGAFDFLLKPVHARALEKSVRSAIQCSRDRLAHATELHDLEQRYGILSSREKQVMSCVVTGLLNKQVAAQLEVSEITVKVHRGRVMRKMRARSLAELVRMSTRLSGLGCSSFKDRG